MVDSPQFEELRTATITYSEEVPDFKQYFQKLILIWRNHVQTVNRRIRAAVLVEPSSSEYADVVQRFPTTLTSVEHEIRKLVCKTDAVFSSKTYEISAFVDDLTVEFRSILLAENSELKHPHIPFAYRIQSHPIDEKSLILSVLVPKFTSKDESNWLDKTAFRALERWLKGIDLEKKMAPSNRLIDIEGYTETYNTIKDTLGKDLVKIWPEKTSPEKFVYEDCGIASYLLELFKVIKFTPKKFADIGCGNGLLVHLLNKQGIDGIGLDIRKRKIWSELFGDVALIETTVNPSLSKGENGLPLDCDFLIGNHSDELTPWMAIMAARLNCPFFVIPCCPFDFHSKFQAKGSSSAYQSFMDFVHNVCLKLGFDVQQDKLSIPSTKRACFVCTIPPGGLVKNIEEVIAELTKSVGPQKEFVARPKVEKVQNCSNVPVEIRNDLRNRIFKRLLAESEEVKDGWHVGAAIPLSSIQEMLSNEEKALMKNQNGGIQTFIKNQHQVFRVISGCVRIRDWRIADEWTKKKESRPPNKKPRLTRTTECWMLRNHPDGCPLNAEDCRFDHNIPNEVPQDSR